MSWSFLDFTGLSHFFGKLPEKLVTTHTTQTISGTKSFSSTILGSVSGSAASAAKDGAGNVIADTYETKADAATHLSKSDAAGTYLSKSDAADTYQTKAGLSSQITTTVKSGWYTNFPDGAEAHNATWGGRDITAAFDAGTVSANIANGTFRDIFPGDYITKQVTISGTAYTVNWVIADCDYWWHKGDQNNGMETHHVAIVPQAPIFGANMNATNTTEGGYAGSAMHKNVIPACATGIVGAFGSGHILTFRDLITNTVDNNVASRGYCGWTGASAPWDAWASVQCNLMSEAMVTGAPHYSSSGFDDEITTRQMSAFRLSERLINYNRQTYWLRNVVSSAYFASVYGEGIAGPNNASYVYGVRPFALLV